MKCLIFVCLIFVLLSIAADAATLPVLPQPDPPRPDPPVMVCVQCTGEYSPVCALPTGNNANGGKARTFHNSCAVTAADCGYTEPRKLRQLTEILSRNSRTQFLFFQNSRSFKKENASEFGSIFKIQL